MQSEIIHANGYKVLIDYSVGVVSLMENEDLLNQMQAVEERSFNELLNDYWWNICDLNEHLFYDFLTNHYIEKISGRTLCISNDSESLKEMLLELLGTNLKYIDIDDQENFISFQDDSYDNVLIINVLCRTADPNLLVREAKRICKSGGQIILYDMDCFEESFSNTHMDMEYSKHKRPEVLLECSLDRKIGRKLGHILRESGLNEITQIPIIFKKSSLQDIQLTLAFINMEIQEILLVDMINKQAFTNGNANVGLIKEVIKHYLSSSFWIGVGMCAIGIKR